MSLPRQIQDFVRREIAKAMAGAGFVGGAFDAARLTGSTTIAPNLTIKEQDASPSVSSVKEIIVSDGTLTDNGDGSVTLATGTGGSGAPSSAKYVVTESDGTLSQEVVIPGLAASHDIAGVGGAGTSEEYDSGTSPLTWSSAPASEDVDTTAKSHLYVKATDTTERFGTKAWAPAGAFDARCHLVIGGTGTGVNTAGLVISDSNGTNRLLVQLFTNFSLTNPRFSVNVFTFVSGVGTQRGKDIHMPARYLRITRDASNSVTFFCSIDGIAWTQIATLSFTLTVASIGYRLSSSGTPRLEMFSDWLRTDV